MAWWIAIIPCLVLGIATFNACYWPRGRRRRQFEESVSILIPARNEAGRIGETLRAVMKLEHPLLEIIVYDDNSTDGTAEVVNELGRKDPRIRVQPGAPLPEGWVGKPHACHRLAEQARGDVLFFIDADTLLRPNGLEFAADVFHTLNAEVMSAVPRQLMGTWAEKLVIPLLHLTYLSWLPMPLVWRSRDIRFMAANGQIVVVRASSYRAFGGFSSVRSEVVDDMAFCRLAKARGHRVVFADGVHMADCRMYTTASEVWAGFSKNLYEGVGGRPERLAGALAVNGAAFLIPWVVLPFSISLPWLFKPAMVGIGANLIQRIYIARMYRQALSTVALHPFSILALFAIGLNSWSWHRRGSIRWRGRSYGTRKQRGESE